MGCGLLMLIIGGFFFWPLWILAIVVAVMAVKK